MGTFIQGELTEAVKTLDLGVQAAQAEHDLASEAAARFVTVRIVAKPEAKPATPAKAVGSLKNSAIMQRLQAQKAGAESPSGGSEASGQVEAK